jgi:hypothetical protein
MDKWGEERRLHKVRVNEQSVWWRDDAEFKSWDEESGDEIGANNLHSYRGCMKETNT